MSLPTSSYVTLGLIAKHPGSGYDIAGLAERSIAHFWAIPRSQLYTELTRLESLEFVTGTTIRQDRLPDKRVYEVTTTGLEALREWLDGHGYERLRSKNAALLKFFFGKFMAPARLSALLQEYRSDAERQRAELLAIAHRLESQLTPERLFGLATIRHGVLQAEAAVAWTYEAEKLVERALSEEIL
ncbi:MAG: PadR family transcriptional regulator [Actinomycetota bacterium]|nr:PadR family transcriptional regulator [Actinomycetota bacterium]